MEDSTDDGIPPVFFSRKWQSIKDTLHCPGLRWVDRENVVMHVSMKSQSARNYLRVATGADTHGCQKPHVLSRAVWSGADLDSPFRHLRYNTRHNGKILKFEKNNNIIRGIYID
jgi:hypothetical protein